MYGLKRKEATPVSTEVKPKETLAHKMIRDIIGVDPQEMIAEFTKIAGQIKAGVDAMQSIDGRVAKLENAVDRIEALLTKKEG